MILGLPDEWVVTTTLDGAVVDTPVGRVVHVASAPLVRARDLVAQRLAWRPGYELAHVEPAITDEGEYAVLASARMTTTAREIAWGIVYADESLAFYELEATPDLAARAREVVALAARAHRFALGVRWRRYRYAIPPAWDAIARGLVTDWYAPGAPRTWAVLTVYPALPVTGLTVGVVPSLVQNAKAQGLVPSSEQSFVPASDHGLEGVGTVITGTFRDRPVKLQIAAFLDDRYVYAMELQSRSLSEWTDQQAVHVATLASVEPLPRPRGRASGEE